MKENIIDIRNELVFKNFMWGNFDQMEVCLKLSPCLRHLSKILFNPSIIPNYILKV